MENFIELKNKVLLAGLQRVYNTDKIFGNQCAAFFFAGFFSTLHALLYFGFISTREFISSPSRSYSSTWPLVHTFMRSVRSLVLGARMKS